ncbi:MAG: phosphate ABC transporter substrate-binding protein [Dehalococcoidales bacterium]|nr:phosphate ABC transporter substrate-binding protein [Dehalococcoidales bacterium]
MNKTKKITFILVSTLLLLTAILAGCTQKTTTPTDTNTTSTLAGTITESGSTTVQPLAEQLGEAFSTVYPQVKVVIQGGGTAVGIKAATDGTVDIGAASRDLTDAEKPGLVTTVIARDGIAIIVNPAQSVANLTKQQVIDIFSGTITNWKEVGGADKKITVVSREEGSGTRTAFQDLILGKTAQIAATAILQPSNGAIRTTVAGDPSAIAYLSCGYVDTSVKVVNLDGVAGTEANVKNGTYKYVRPLLFITKGQPSGLVKSFLDFCLSDAGQNIVSIDYIPVK